MYRITNTAEDRRKHILHRTALKFELEPSLGGYRIRLGTYYDITDEHYDRVKSTIAEWEKNGMVDVRKLGSDGVDTGASGIWPDQDENGLLRGGPTIEEWVAAGYQKENYPPKGYAEVFSPGLVAYKRAQEEAVSNVVAPFPGSHEDRPFDPNRDYVIKPTDIDEANAQIRASQEVATKATEVIKEALSLPTVTEQILPATPIPAFSSPVPVQVSVPAPPPPASKADKNKKFR